MTSVQLSKKYDRPSEQQLHALLVYFAATWRLSASELLWRFYFSAAWTEK